MGSGEARWYVNDQNASIVITELFDRHAVAESLT